MLYKNKQVEEKELIKDRVIELEEMVKGLSYYKELVEEQEKVVEWWISMRIQE